MAPVAAGGRGLVLPGRAYGPDRPLLHVARLHLERHGWAPEDVSWDAPALAVAMADGPVATTAYVEGVVAAQAGADGGDEPGQVSVLVVAKSLGTRAAAYAARREWPAIWLTPLLDDRGCRDGIAANPAPQLLVGGARDPFWDGPTALELGRLATPGALDVLDVPDADHAMLVDDDPVRGAEILAEVSRAVEAFLARVSGR